MKFCYFYKLYICNLQFFDRYFPKGVGLWSLLGENISIKSTNEDIELYYKIKKNKSIVQCTTKSIFKIRRKMFY